MLLPLLLLLPLAASWPASHASRPALDVFVDPLHGDDDAMLPVADPGGATRAGSVTRRPVVVRTVHAAAAHARQQLASQPGIDVTVHLLSGHHYVGAAPLTLGPNDSGSHGAHVTWRGEPGSVLSGGVEIPVSAWSPVPGPPQHPPVWQANLTALGLPKHALGVVGQGSVLDGRGDASAFAELFYSGEAATLARWPNKAADGSTVYAYTLGGVCGGPKIRGGCSGGKASAPCSLGCGGSLARQCSSAWLHRHRLALCTPL